ncbi:Phosphatidylcholine:ceramide cholinephosphotransferase 1 [Trichinella pseudospiralis]|uniref:Phosphatidylcholine:ceramide cholinephosphotransferase 1 n=1 Tax=Trichinella pseudospiralis TaxID=6337 RepID=A0A0V1ED67_TRIPS|nr:Phosphatidylcholine:ceramide cholinephosphotransferase 1 [Trichinella pseudospiralis]KRZ27311.1 Phosphatidylcholine:ceramide cholinephosphotransferase 1 [Trichinella pseudospiralis]
MAAEDQQDMADRVKLNGHCVESDRGEETVLIDIGDTGETSLSSSSVKKFPKEPKKLLLSVLLLFIAAMTNDVVLAWIHERVPETPPLPDLFFTLAPHFPNALAASEYLIMVSSGIMFIVCLLHRHRFVCLLYLHIIFQLNKIILFTFTIHSFIHSFRWILLRRVFFMLSLLYLGRCVCMLVTQVPLADPDYFCSPKSNNTTFGDVLLRALRLFSGAGLNIFGKHTFCGDYIFSGHTLILVMTYLVVKEYSPRRFWHLHLLTWSVSASGILCILLSRGHYSIDVVIAYFITTRLFWLYHTLANSAELREYSVTNLMSRECWFPLFRYMECNVAPSVPRQFEWPLSWPRCFKSTSLSGSRLR